jgi:hypothetical protein
MARRCSRSGKLFSNESSKDLEEEGLELTSQNILGDGTRSAPAEAEIDLWNNVNSDRPEGMAEFGPAKQ